MKAKNKLEFVEYTSREYGDIIMSTETPQELGALLNAPPAGITVEEKAIHLSGGPFTTLYITDDSKGHDFVLAYLRNGKLSWYRA